MRFETARTSGIAAAIFMTAINCTPAFALDGDALGARFKALAEKQNIAVTFDGVETSGSNAVLKNLAIQAMGQDQKLDVGDVHFTDIEETGNGGYIIGEIALPDYSFDDKQFNLSFAGIRANGVKLPAEDASDALTQVMLYDHMGIDSVLMKDGGTEIVTAKNFNGKMAIPEDANGKVTFTGGIETLNVNLAEIKGPDADKSREVMKQLGYDNIEMSMDIAGSWTPADGRVVLETEKITMKDAASLNISLDLGGYTPDFLESIRQISRQMNDGTPEQKSAQGLAMMGLMQQLVLHSASIRIEDASLTNRILDYVAAQQGVKREDVVNQAKGVVPFMLARLGDADFATKVTEAVSSYLDSPQYIEISVKPTDPLPFAMVMATGMTAPQNLPQQLGVTVTANE